MAGCGGGDGTHDGATPSGGPSPRSSAPASPPRRLSAVRHSDRAYVDNANTRSVPSWTLYDLGLRYRFDSPWGKDAALRLTLENVLDKNFWISRTYGVYQSSPRTLLMSLSTRF